MIVEPLCEQFKKEFDSLAKNHNIDYTIVTDDTHITVYARIQRDFTNRDHLSPKPPLNQPWNEKTKFDCFSSEKI